MASNQSLADEMLRAQIDNVKADTARKYAEADETAARTAEINARVKSQYGK